MIILEIMGMVEEQLGALKLLTVIPNDRQMVVLKLTVV